MDIRDKYVGMQQIYVTAQDEYVDIEKHVACQHIYLSCYINMLHANIKKLDVDIIVCMSKCISCMLT